MEKQRKIAMVVKKVSFQEAEAKDDIFWSGATYLERFEALIGIRKMQYGAFVGTIKKVVSKQSLNEKEAN